MFSGWAAYVFAMVGNALLGVGDFGHSPLLLKHPNAGLSFVFGQMLDGLQELGIFLANDAIKERAPHP